MRKRIDSGLWEIFLPSVVEGSNYKYEIVGPDGALLPLKADPFGFSAELRPSTASVVARTDLHEWEDAEFLEKRAKEYPRRAPMAIYEVHLGSWRRGDKDRFLTYDELANTLIPYAVEMGIHASRISARQRTSARCLMGLSADRPFRADAAFRRSAGLSAFHRSRASGRTRRDPRLGAGAFSDR
jgi:1,4-alpha-glucan branching enzyme